MQLTEVSFQIETFSIMPIVKLLTTGSSSKESVVFSIGAENGRQQKFDINFSIIQKNIPNTDGNGMNCELILNGNREFGDQNFVEFKIIISGMIVP